MWIEHVTEIFDCLKREQDICFKIIIPSQIRPSGVPPSNNI